MDSFGLPRSGLLCFHSAADDGSGGDSGHVEAALEQVGAALVLAAAYMFAGSFTQQRHPLVASPVVQLDH